MDWASVLNAVLIPALVGLGGLVVWLVKFYIPAIEKRKDIELEARLNEQRIKLEAELRNKEDTREHLQSTENVALDILREAIHEYSREMTELRTIIYKLGRQVENMVLAVRTLTSVVSDREN